MMRGKYIQTVHDLKGQMLFYKDDLASKLLAHDDEQRQIIDEQVEENRGLRRDVHLMQKVNAEQRAEIERLQARVAKWERVEALDMSVFNLSDKELTAEFYHNAANVARQMEERWKESDTRIKHQAKEITRLWEALRRLRNEVSGLVYLDEKSLRETFGNTNVSIVLLRLKEAEQALKEHP